MLSFKVMSASLDIVRREYEGGAIGAMGISREDWAKMRQPHMWTIQDRVSLQRVMLSLRDGLASAQGFTPFRVPAEFQAAFIAGLVAPINWRAACSWVASFPQQPAEDQAAGILVGSSDDVTDAQLFALCLQAQAQDQQFIDRFNRKVKKEEERSKQE